MFTLSMLEVPLRCPCQARQDILAQDLAEAIDSQVELAEQLRCYREDNEKLLSEKQAVCVPHTFRITQGGLNFWYDLHTLHALCAQLLDLKENLTLEVQQLTQDCKMQQQKNAVIQTQMRELLAERDQVAPRFDDSGIVPVCVDEQRSSLLHEKIQATSCKVQVKNPVLPGPQSSRVFCFAGYAVTKETGGGAGSKQLSAWWGKKIPVGLWPWVNAKENIKKIQSASCGVSVY